MSELQDKLKKMVSMALLGVGAKDIADTFGITEQQVLQIQDRPEYRDLYAAEARTVSERMSRFNDSWDSVEEQAVRIIGSTLKTNMDPEYALRAAMVANRANRRGGSLKDQMPLQASMGQRVAVQMNTMLLQQFIVQTDTISKEFGGQVQHNIATGVTKRSNLLEPGSVGKMFSSMEQQSVIDVADVGKILDNVDA